MNGLIILQYGTVPYPSGTVQYVLVFVYSYISRMISGLLQRVTRDGLFVHTQMWCYVFLVIGLFFLGASIYMASKKGVAPTASAKNSLASLWAKAANKTAPEPAVSSTIASS